jgi:hypothetical protein
MQSQHAVTDVRADSGGRDSTQNLPPATMREGNTRPAECSADAFMQSGVSNPSGN